MPLAKSKKEDNRFCYQFQIIINATEIAKACLEANDPEEQINNLNQHQLSTEGSTERAATDPEFIEALYNGMPPTGGLGIGIDRIIKVFTNSDSIRDTIIFPILKNKN